jgi:hypothetical protein
MKIGRLNLTFLEISTNLAIERYRIFMILEFRKIGLTGGVYGWREGEYGGTIFDNWVY